MTSTDSLPYLTLAAPPQSWAEYSPTCLTVGGVKFTVAEPKNAISSLRFDDVACDTQPGQEALAESASHLGFGSFAMHSSGSHPVTGMLDTVPMSCFTLNLLYQMLLKTGSSMNVRRRRRARRAPRARARAPARPPARPPPHTHHSYNHATALVKPMGILRYV